jgi:S-adenosylmethionine decarboxylase proenzyme, Bacillus form
MKYNVERLKSCPFLKLEGLGVLGYNIFADMYGCDTKLLDDIKYLNRLLREAANAGNMHIVKVFFHKYSPQGITGLVIVKESHIALHTWPEYAFASVDIFLCGNNSNPYKTLKHIENGLKPSKVITKSIERGVIHEELTEEVMGNRRDL